MSDQTLENITQTQFDIAEQMLISIIRSSYPTLDMRRGTVIRDLLIRPAASVYALNTSNLVTLASKMSIVTLSQDPTATADDYNAILANLGTSLIAGTPSSGKAIITVDTLREYSLGANFVFTDINGNQYQTTQDYTIKAGATGSDIPLNTNTDGSYYFILPLTALAAGAAGNIQQGTALTPSGDLFGFLSGEAYSDFSGGQNAETIEAATQRLPASIAYRALESSASIDAKLRNEFASGSISIQALNVSGYGRRTQLRDKHNPMGFAVGSRVDVYVRTYTAPRVTTLLKTGTRIGSSTYQFTINAADAPGFSAIRSVSEVEAVVAPTLGFGTLIVIGSYPFAEVRSAVGLTGTSHDIDLANSVIETAYTAYQQAVVTVTNVPAGTATHDFKVELYAADGIKDIQDYVDNRAVSNVEADYIIRSPLMCVVGSKIRAYCSSTNVVTPETLNTALVAYVNSRSFLNQLTRSELVNIMLANGVTRVDLSSNGMILTGVIRDAAGILHTISGDSLDIEGISSPAVLLAPETTVFATEPGQFVIEVITE